MRFDLIFLMRDITSIPSWTDSQNSVPAAEATSLKISSHGLIYLSNDHTDCPNQHRNTRKLFDEKGYPVLKLKESQGKLRQQYDQNFPMEAKPLHSIS